MLAGPARRPLPGLYPPPDRTGAGGPVAGRAVAGTAEWGYPGG
jgi:hypothetical protein